MVLYGFIPLLLKHPDPSKGYDATIITPHPLSKPSYSKYFFIYINIFNFEGFTNTKYMYIKYFFRYLSSSKNFKDFEKEILNQPAYPPLTITPHFRPLNRPWCNRLGNPVKAYIYQVFNYLFFFN